MTFKKYSACTSILVGKKASIDGSVMIGRNEDAKSAWPKHFVVHPHGELESQFKSSDNHFRVNLPEPSGRYTATPEWTDQYGLFEEDGINEYGVAMSATESAYSNSRVLAADPLVEEGLNEEAMVTVVLPFIKSARQGVLRLGKLIAEYGTNESNGILFADDQEAWYLETAGGHYWVAQRIPDDCYAVVANQLSIQQIDFSDSNHFLFHPHIQEFVELNHLNPTPGKFDFRLIFGTHDRSDAVYNTPRVWYGHQLFSSNQSQNETPESMALPFIMKPDHLISVTEVQQYLSSHFNGTPFDPLGHGSVTDKRKYRPISLAKTQESHVLQMGRSTANIHWLSMGVSAQSVYVPFFADITNTPRDYQIGRETYSPQSAYWVFKHAGILVDAHLKEFLPLLTNLQAQLQVFFLETVLETDRYLQSVTDVNRREEYLTDQSSKMAKRALHDFRQLTAELITKATDMSPLNFKTDENL